MAAAVAAAPPTRVPTSTFVMAPVDYSSNPTVATIHTALVSQCQQLIKQTYEHLGMLGGYGYQMDFEISLGGVMGAESPHPFPIRDQLYKYTLCYEAGLQFSSILKKFQEEMQKAIAHIGTTAGDALKEHSIMKIALTDQAQSLSLRKAAEQFRLLEVNFLLIHTAISNLDRCLEVFAERQLFILGNKIRPDLFPYCGTHRIPSAAALAPKADDRKEGGGPAAEAPPRAS